MNPRSLRTVFLIEINGVRVIDFVFGSIDAVTELYGPGNKDYGVQVNHSQVVLTTNVEASVLVNKLKTFTNQVNQEQISYNPFIRNSNSFVYQAAQVLTGARPPAQVWAPGSQTVLPVP